MSDHSYGYEQVKAIIDDIYDYHLFTHETEPPVLDHHSREQFLWPYSFYPMPGDLYIVLGRNYKPLGYMGHGYVTYDETFSGLGIRIDELHMAAASKVGMRRCDPHNPEQFWIYHDHSPSPFWPQLYDDALVRYVTQLSTLIGYWGQGYNLHCEDDLITELRDFALRR